MIKSEEKQQLWFDYIKACESSGLTQPEFCRKNNLSMNTFAYYRGQYLSKRPSANPSPPSFVELHLPPVTLEAFSMSLPNGIKLSVPQLFNDRQLVKLIEVLRSC
jgi:hypothetical protein